MELTPEYLAEQKDCIQRNFLGYKNNIKDAVTLQRLNILKKFVQGSVKSLSVGCGGFEPTFIHTNNACDVHEVSGQILKQHGWDGSFFVCSCDNIPVPNFFYDDAVCSEVIEHLPNISIVRDTFVELNRVSKRWIVTTPTRDVQEPTHKFIFTLEQLQTLTADIPCMIEQQGLFFYIHNGERKLFN